MCTMRPGVGEPAIYIKPKPMYVIFNIIIDKIIVIVESNKMLTLAWR